MRKWITSWFKTPSENQNIKEDFMKKFLIVGLGNIGSKYSKTRHNIGFQILDYYSKTYNLTWESGKFGEIAQHKIKGRTVILLKPNTFMNLSGKAVRYWLTKEKIPLENLLIITDDLNLPFGTIRIRTKGSAGGHNGLKDIQQTLQTTNYNRFRFGISDDFSKGEQIEYVLGEWEPNELAQMNERLALSNEVIDSFVLAGVTNTMNTYNGK